MPSTNRSLLDIADDMEALDDFLFGCGGDVTDPEVEAYVNNWFAANEAALQSKTDGYAKYIHELQGRAEIAKLQSDRLMAKSRTATRQADFLRAKLKAVMEMRGLQKIQGDYATVSIVNNGGVLPLNVDETQPIPDTFTKIIVKPDNEKIRAALDGGEELTFASLGERGTRLSIR